MNFIKRLLGKLRNTVCPICGRWMEKEKIRFLDKTVDIWYCKNAKHENTCPEGIIVEQILPVPAKKK